MAGFDPSRDQLSSAELLPLDRWIIRRAAALQAELLDAYDTYQFHHVYHKVHNFCSGELGGFYLDVIKDRQYTTQADSQPRRSAQTALYHLAEALACWIAPVLSFTAEEIWENLPGEHASSVFLSTWYELPGDVTDDEFDDEFWSTCQQVRQDVNKALEASRAEGKVRGSLDANVTLYASDELRATLERLDDELRFVLITSDAACSALDEAPSDAFTGELEGLRVVVVASDAEKCERCWHKRDDVGQVAAHPTLCVRCVTNVDGEGEVRHYA